MTAWWSGLPPAEASVTCDGSTHVLRWERGTLIAPAHGDPEAEATLAALAGTTYPCLEHLSAWRRRRADPRVLAVAARGPMDRLSIDLTNPRHMRMQRPRTDQELISLLGLGGGLPDRLQATVAATWARRLHRGHRALERTRPQLHAALYGRVLSALRAWLDEPQLELALEMVDPGAPRSLRRSGDGATISAALPFAWVSEVWARDVAVVLGRLCVGAQVSDDGASWTLETVGPDLAPASPVSIDL